eukprot:CAMPEP_0116995844 /NCGR_PEP_ID=MMETSP0467-20121206/69043_1 /TAXON_ID=283647 /ORGANISM="Mesodinium pulex, Strain SPMC105" /LENGTH=65 /DNA_ID=CAMNT_0004694331 /DNA_START=744 /DNA_END=938 /DNA_ORIENTATION=-
MSLDFREPFGLIEFFFDEFVLVFLDLNQGFEYFDIDEFPAFDVFLLLQNFKRGLVLVDDSAEGAV